MGVLPLSELDHPGLSPGARVVTLSLSPLGSKYYEKEALLADPVFGPVLACLLGELENLKACVGSVE